MSARGFSLVELLVALTVCALLSGAMAGIVGPARAAFDSTPHALDLQQRLRTAANVITGALRGAGADVGATIGAGSPFEDPPLVILMDPDQGDATGTRFGSLYVLTRLKAQGVLDRDQPGPGAPLTIATTGRCPNTADVCGFLAGMHAAIVDGTGRFDVFTVAAANPASSQLSVTAPFEGSYPEGSMVMEVEADTYRLAPQADGSSTLVRETGGGAVQPVVEDVASVSFQGWRDAGDPSELVPVTASALEDGPWRGGGPEGWYDADLVDIRRIDITLRVSVAAAMLRGPSGQLFDRAGTGAHAPLRWVPDRTVRMSITLRNAR